MEKEDAPATDEGVENSECTDADIANCNRRCQPTCTTCPTGWDHPPPSCLTCISNCVNCCSDCGSNCGKEQSDLSNDQEELDKPLEELLDVLEEDVGSAFFDFEEE